MLLLLSFVWGAVAAAVADYVPVDPPGPPLAEDPASLAAALECGAPAGDGRPIVLLVPGTALDPGSNFDWNWKPALETHGRQVCTVTLIENGMVDIQRSAERIVYAIRGLHDRSNAASADRRHSKAAT